MTEEPPQLSDEDLARVDEYLNSGYNTTERPSFKPLRLLFVLFIIVSGMSLFSLGVARYYGIY